MLRRYLVTFACLLTLVVAFYTIELWRGEHAWAAYQTDLAAHGAAPPTIAQLIPPLVPDDQNFAMTSVLKPFFPAGRNNHYSLNLEWPAAPGHDPEGGIPGSAANWRLGQFEDLKPWQEFLGSTDLLQPLKKFDPVLDEISAASRRPYSRFPIDYEKGYAAMIPHIGTFITLSRIYRLRALAEIAEGQNDRAAEDVVTILKLAHSQTNEPALISQLTAFAIVGIDLQVVWEGLARHSWTDAQITEIQTELGKFDFLADEVRSLQAERATADNFLEQYLVDPNKRIQFFQQVRSLTAGNAEGPRFSAMVYLFNYLVPRGWIYQNRLALSQNAQEMIAEIDAPNHQVDAARVDAHEKQLVDFPKSPYTFLTGIFSVSDHLTRVFAFSQVTIDEAQVACALERYRLANQQYPEQLAALAPQYMAKLPPDVVSGKQLIYHRDLPNHFVLYSVGWNGTDDGGNPNDPQIADNCTMADDWLWPCPVPAKAN